ncbi:MAG: response regulator transcription factor [Oscillospiraceae bacterium]|nr:response regulator transcription factor [Oscillospiraceae bacterium]
MERLLLVEDDAAITRTLLSFLRTEGFEAGAAAGQDEAVALLRAEPFDLALVDISLAQGNGFAVCAAAKGLDVPVIFLTASDDEYSVVTGLDMGADDYISKPFRPRELISRIRSVLRRCGKRQSVLQLGDVAVDTVKGTVTRQGADLFLSALEYRLLLIFLNNRGQILSRARLLEELWDSAGEFVEDNTLTVYIKRLREKIEPDPREPRWIRTVRGLGYRLEDGV